MLIGNVKEMKTWTRSFKNKKKKSKAIIIAIKAVIEIKKKKTTKIAYIPSYRSKYNEW